jgi:iron complex transport system ATP-binding protein
VASGPTADVITADMLKQIYRVDARIESCSKGMPIIIVDGSFV